MSSEIPANFIGEWTGRVSGRRFVLRQITIKQRHRIPQSSGERKDTPPPPGCRDNPNPQPGFNECSPTPLVQLGPRASLRLVTRYRGVAARWWCRTFLGTCTCGVVRGSQANIELWALPAAVLDLASFGQYRLSEIVAPA